MVQDAKYMSYGAPGSVNPFGESDPAANGVECVTDWDAPSVVAAVGKAAANKINASNADRRACLTAIPSIDESFW